MVKLPSYIKIDEIKCVLGATMVRVTARIRWWHPGAWWLIARIVWTRFTDWLYNVQENEQENDEL